MDCRRQMMFCMGQGRYRGIAVCVWCLWRLDVVLKVMCAVKA